MSRRWFHLLDLTMRLWRDSFLSRPDDGTLLARLLDPCTGLDATAAGREGGR